MGEYSLGLVAHRLANILYLIGQADIPSLAQLAKCSTFPPYTHRDRSHLPEERRAKHVLCT